MIELERSTRVIESRYATHLFFNVGS